MTAYIVALIVGSLTTVSPLIYLMNYDRCVADILSKQPDFDTAAFSPAITPFLAYGITVVGAFVLIVSTVMIAITGLKQLQNARGASETPPLPGSAAVADEDDSPVDTEEETVF